MSGVNLSGNSEINHFQINKEKSVRMISQRIKQHTLSIQTATKIRIA
jgi:hypothetical protein